MNYKQAQLFESLVCLEDMPESIKPIALEIGIENTIKLCKYVNGDDIYIPQAKTLLISVRNRAIAKKYTGYNHRELAKEYNLTKKQIKNILKLEEDH